MSNAVMFAQERTNCLASKHLHVKEIRRLRGLNQLVDFLAIAVPILFFLVRYFFKATEYERAAEVMWEISAVVLLVLVVLKMAYHWQERAETHSKLLGQNIAMANQARALMQVDPSPEARRLFEIMGSELEQADREAFGKVPETDRQFAYREALKEVSAANTEGCPECGASPWRFTPGRCQLCGGTPNNTKET